MTRPPAWAAAAAELDDVIRQVAAERPGWFEARLRPPYIVIDRSGCWVWQRQKNAKGYSRITIPQPFSRKVRAHRVSYILNRGPIPYGMTLDHLCRNTSCVNPDHLEPCSPEENRTRSPHDFAALQTVKTHCPQGHPYEEANLRPNKVREGERDCSICHRARLQRDYALHRLAAQRLGITVTDYRTQYGHGGKAAAEVLGIPWEAARHLAA
jgi:hypothetical protein